MKNREFVDHRIAEHFPYYNGEAIQIEEIFDEVQAELLDREKLCPIDPPLTKSQIDHVFWVLGNMGLFPDYVEQCRECERYYNSESEGCYLDAKGPDDKSEDIGAYCSACLTEDIWRRAHDLEPEESDDESE